jgi:hypothetical protein
MIGLAARLQLEMSVWKKLLEQFDHSLRVACPGIIQSFNASSQTVKVKLALREKVIYDDAPPTWVDIPVLVDVPILIPRAGGFALTLPVSAGDECLVVFGDMCIDAWWQSGGVQNQMDRRRHDLSDGFAVLGIWSQPRVLSDYSVDSAQLRSDDGNVMVEVKSNEINVNAATVNVTSTKANINAATTDDVTINFHKFLDHRHYALPSSPYPTGIVYPDDGP